MHTVTLDAPDDFDGWRAGAKAALIARVKPADILFRPPEQGRDLFGSDAAAPGPAKTVDAPRITVPKAFVDLIRQVVCHTDEERFALAYRLLVRLQDDRTLMGQPSDPDIWRATRLAKEVRRDMHKMKAFVRFRKIDTEDGEDEGVREKFVAWFEPSQNIVRATAPFFMRRFTAMDWSILTPRGCAHWDGTALTFTEAADRSEAPTGDALEDYWRTYYASIFNPARLKLDAMQSEMPKKYWNNLPEASLIPSLIQSAGEREAIMVEQDATTPNEAMMRAAERPVATDGFIHTLPPADPIEGLDELNEKLRHCRACPLWEGATQAVCGAGTQRATIMLVGEQPGDNEDLQGRAFIGPAGKVLAEAFEEAGIDREETWLTNAVKHFKFEPRGKRRVHKNPSMGEIDHCSFWLTKELELVRPRVVVALGASAVRGLTGKTHKMGDLRGVATPLADLMKKGRDLPDGLAGGLFDGANDNGVQLVSTYHPSYILRVPDAEASARARGVLVDGLRLAKELAG